MRAIHKVRGTMAPLAMTNVDTDQIIPARFLKTTQREGLGTGLFADWRLRSDGTEEPGFVLNRALYRKASILVVGENFGCGSSREHAAWALLDHGIRCVVSTGFADIFRANALGNGLLAAEVRSEDFTRMLTAAAESPSLEVEADLESCLFSIPDQESITFEIDPFARRCLLSGLDKLGYLLEALPETEAYEERRPVPVETRVGGSGL